MPIAGLPILAILLNRSPLVLGEDATCATAVSMILMYTHRERVMYRSVFSLTVTVTVAEESGGFHVTLGRCCSLLSLQSHYLYLSLVMSDRYYSEW